MTVRDPVVTTVSLPRFLAPGDSGAIGVTINNLEGAAGDYHLTLSATGAAGFATPVEADRASRPGRHIHRWLFVVGDDFRQCSPET